MVTDDDWTFILVLERIDLERIDLEALLYLALCLVALLD